MKKEKVFEVVNFHTEFFSQLVHYVFKLVLRFQIPLKFTYGRLLERILHLEHKYNRNIEGNSF